MLPTPKQLHVLERFGWKAPFALTRAEAARLLGIIAARGWRR